MANLQANWLKDEEGHDKTGFRELVSKVELTGKVHKKGLGQKDLDNHTQDEAAETMKSLGLQTQRARQC